MVVTGMRQMWIGGEPSTEASGGSSRIVTAGNFSSASPKACAGGAQV